MSFFTELEREQYRSDAFGEFRPQAGFALGNPLDVPFRPRPAAIGFILAALPPAIRDHVPDAYLHALGSPIVT